MTPPDLDPVPRARAWAALDAFAQGYPMARYCWWWWALGGHRRADGHQCGGERAKGV